MRDFRIIITLSVIINIIAIYQSANAGHNQYLFEQGNQLYQNEKYPEAIVKYQEIINGGTESWQLYFNLANSYYRTAQFGRSILYYERALKMEPENEDIQFNLNLANLTVMDKVVKPPEFFIIKLFAGIKDFWGITVLTWMLISTYLTFSFFVITKIISRKNPLQRLINVFLVPVTVFLIFISTIFGIRVHENKTLHYAIVLEKEVHVLGSPDEQGTELFSLHEGVKIKVEDTRTKWAKIRLSDGKVGWVNLEVFEII